MSMQPIIVRDGEPILGPKGANLAYVADGPKVEAWRNFLIGAGYNAGVPGSGWTLALTDATKIFQRDNGLLADGTVGADTRDAARLKGFSAGPAAVTSVEMNEVAITADAGDKPMGTNTAAVLDRQLWQGGPSVATAVGAAGLGLSVFLLLKLLIGMRPQRPAIGQAALMAPQYGGDCGCGR